MITRGARPPVIGITACRRILSGHPFHAAVEKYLIAVAEGAGGVPLIVPALCPPLSHDIILGALDGLLMTGSKSDVESHHYGGPGNPETSIHDPARDALTLPLVRAAVTAGVPVLAICRGHQELNVALGGTLHPRLHVVDGFADHREPEGNDLNEQYGPAHPVRLRPGGLLDQLARSIGADPNALIVNSLHGQGIDRLAPGLVIEACAPDGVIEAICVPHAPAFALGVQWHPEWRWAENPFSRALFTAFGAACAHRSAVRLGEYVR